MFVSQPDIQVKIHVPVCPFKQRLHCLRASTAFRTSAVRELVCFFIFIASPGFHPLRPSLFEFQQLLERLVRALRVLDPAKQQQKKGVMRADLPKEEKKTIAISELEAKTYPTTAILMVFPSAFPSPLLLNSKKTGTNS